MGRKRKSAFAFVNGVDRAQGLVRFLQERRMGRARAQGAAVVALDMGGEGDERERLAALSCVVLHDADVLVCALRHRRAGQLLRKHNSVNVMIRSRRLHTIPD